ncbi:MAG: glucose 1-dehydrogenase [Rhodospirillaceae bacterium]|nr:glucose 1-dehydrogenase [Rhodospirillaceae bacterium]MCY4236943.1 glucose 1-dehydrogenase [Rhodospirillaceae bacterium]
MQLEQKVAVITGAASGFGEGIARRYAAEGARVVVVDLNDQLGSKVAGEIGGAYIHADVANRDDVRRMIQTAVDEHERLDVMVNNAGVTHVNRPMLEVKEEEFDRIFNVNVKSIYLAALEAVPVMRAQGGGCIINTASTAGLRPRPGLAWYNASKGAVITMTKSMAVELGPDNIRVNALCPVAGDTPLLPSFLGANTREAFQATVPLGRLSTAEDVAKAALWLASAEADFITGVALEIDGGRCV